MKSLAAIFALVLVASCPSFATAATEIIASNGTTISVDGDEFKPRTDYSAPYNRGDGGGYIFNVRRLKSGVVSYQVQGFTIYDGEWRMYDRAYLPGGEAVEFSSSGRKVVRCGRYSACTLNEGYLLLLTPAQVAAAINSGSLRAQISGNGLGEFVITVPADQITAALEVADINLSASAESEPQPAVDQQESENPKLGI